MINRHISFSASNSPGRAYNWHVLDALLDETWSDILLTAGRSVQPNFDKLAVELGRLRWSKAADRGLIKRSLQLERSRAARISTRERSPNARWRSPPTSASTPTRIS